MPLPMAPESATSNPSRASSQSHPPHARAEDHVAEERARISGRMNDIRFRIGVHSGKGGVGKTFVACNLALTLATEGNRVGLLDADIDCPNVHEFLGVHERHLLDDDDRIIPIIHPSIRSCSIVSTGFLQERGEPLIIRGPIKHRILTDFVEKTAWGPLDYLVIDFPPGTSDVPLSAMQFFDLTGIILVTTPQREAIADVTRAAGMARKLGVPILGLISNMEGDVFGHGGATLARALDVPFLGAIPLSRTIREANDRGDVAFLEPELETFTKGLLDSLFSR